MLRRTQGSPVRASSDRPEGSDAHTNQDRRESDFERIARADRRDLQALARRSSRTRRSNAPTRPFDAGRERAARIRPMSGAGPAARRRGRLLHGVFGRPAKGSGDSGLAPRAKAPTAHRRGAGEKVVLGDDGTIRQPLSGARFSRSERDGQTVGSRYDSHPATDSGRAPRVMGLRDARAPLHGHCVRRIPPEWTRGPERPGSPNGPPARGPCDAPLPNDSPPEGISTSAAEFSVDKHYLC